MFCFGICNMYIYISLEFCDFQKTENALAKLPSRMRRYANSKWKFRHKKFLTENFLLIKLHCPPFKSLSRWNDKKIRSVNNRPLAAEISASLKYFISENYVKFLLMGRNAPIFYHLNLFLKFHTNFLENFGLQDAVTGNAKKY